MNYCAFDPNAHSRSLTLLSPPHSPHHQAVSADEGDAEQRVRQGGRPRRHPAPSQVSDREEQDQPERGSVPGTGRG